MVQLYAKGDICGGESPYWSEGQHRLTAVLRRCPAPGVERPTRPTSLAYAERDNPVVVWREPVIQSQERTKSAAGTGRPKSEGRQPKGSGNS
jgi:hypothetical protein